MTPVNLRAVNLRAVDQRTVAEEEDGLRLDRWFRRHFPTLGHGRLEKLLRTGQVRLDGKRAKAGIRVQPGQVVRVPPIEAEPRPERQAKPRLPRLEASEREALEATLLYQDDWLVAIDKPAGLAVQGGTKQQRNLDAMLDQVRFGGKARPRLVHRLDHDTSGVLLLARTAEAARRLTAAFKRKDTRKIYWAAVAGVPRDRLGEISLPLAKQAGSGGEKMAALSTSAGEAATGQDAVTLFARAASYRNLASWLVLRPITGRTHQLRVHTAAIGHPVLGDGKYGGRAAFLARPALARQLHLHAREIALPHPEDGTTLRISAPLPAHMAETWAALGFDPAEGEAWADQLNQLDV